MTKRKFGLVAGLFAVVGLAFGFNAVLAGEGHGEAAKDAFPKCPVMDEPVNLATSFKMDDGPVYVCCKGCIRKIKANPEKFATKIAAQRKAFAKLAKVQVTCPLSGDPIDPNAFAEHNGEKVYTCCNKCAARFKADPAKYQTALASSYTYQTKCPVSGEEIDPTASTTLATGETVHFCCKKCIKKFNDSPASFVKNLEKQHVFIDMEALEKASKKG